jgi:hypothetical protein
MINSGYVIYVLLVVLLYWFWHRMRAQSFEDLLDRSAREHHHVQQIHQRHPQGGSWREFKSWMKEEEMKFEKGADDIFGLEI